jgi:hypothetical protein
MWNRLAFLLLCGVFADSKLQVLNEKVSLFVGLLFSEQKKKDA